jgi:hypothetical protein
MPVRTEAHHIVAKLLTLPAAEEICRNHRWLHEGERWQELILSLLSRVLSLPEGDVRALTNRLRLLGLLNVADWAATRERSGNRAANDIVRRSLELLQEAGAGKSEASKAITVIHDVARVVEDRFDGKVQRCLRSLGDELLASLLRTFSLPSLPEGATKEAFTYWLQNVVNLPISLNDDSVRAFCRTHAITPAELVQAADDLDVSIAVVDDLIHYWVATSKDMGTTQDKSPNVASPVSHVRRARGTRKRTAVKSQKRTG